jgi:hypothetical protein
MCLKSAGLVSATCASGLVSAICGRGIRIYVSGATNIVCPLATNICVLMLLYLCPQAPNICVL